MIRALTDHVWQSTLFVLAAAVVAAALRRNMAQVRHRIWLIASLKFLVPFSILMSLGGAMPRLTPATTAITTSSAPDLSIAVDRIAQPFTSDAFFSLPLTAPQAETNWTTIVLAGIWACGFAVVALMRFRGWRHIRTVVRSSVPIDLEHVSRLRSADRTWVRGEADREPGPPYVRNGAVGVRIPVRSAPGLLEPGVVGLWHPVLLLPAGIEDRLIPRQLEAVLVHELCHVQRRDNLTSAIHMVVETAFWFHPLVWFVGARLVDERERACDEHVLRVCGEPKVYAESILNVCKLYVVLPIACVSGVTGLASPKPFFGGGGSDLRKRVAAILVNRVGLELSLARRVTLAIAAVLAVVLPLTAGMVIKPLSAQSSAASGAKSAAPIPKWDAISVKPCGPDTPPAGRSGAAGLQASPGYVYLSCLTLRGLINLAYGADRLLNKPYGPGGAPGAPDLIRGGPSWASSERFTIEAKADGVTDQNTMTTATGQWAINDTNTGAMLRSLLEDRFQLKTHVATEQQSMYALTVAKSGLKIKPDVPGGCWEFIPGQPAPPHDPNVGLCNGWGGDDWGHWEAHGLTIGNVTPHRGRSFVDGLFFMMHRMVIDRTGLEGRYSFTLEFTPDDSTPGLQGPLAGCGGDAGCEARLVALGISGARPTSFKSGDTIFKALEKLGLKLEPVKAPAEYIVIDRAERPRPNAPSDVVTLPAPTQGSRGPGR